MGEATDEVRTQYQMTVLNFIAKRGTAKLCDIQQAAGSKGLRGHSFPLGQTMSALDVLIKRGYVLRPDPTVLAYSVAPGYAAMRLKQIERIDALLDKHEELKQKSNMDVEVARAAFSKARHRNLAVFIVQRSLRCRRAKLVVELKRNVPGVEPPAYRRTAETEGRLRASVASMKLVTKLTMAKREMPTESVDWDAFT